MTKYEEICAAAETARNEFQAYRERVFRYFGKVVLSLETHCGVPSEKIRFLKWNGQQGEARRYLLVESSMPTWPGAIQYDEVDGFWHLGVSITITPTNFAPQGWVSFVLCIKEEKQVPMVKIGLPGKVQAVHLDVDNARDHYCQSLCDHVVASFRDPAKTTSKSIGFVLGTGQPNY